MKTWRSPSLLLAALALFVRPTTGQTLTHTPSDALPATTASPLEQSNLWALSASAYAYFVPDSREYVQPTFAADRQNLHLEARYNYENLNTGSAWLGYNFGGGDKLAWELTPMLGGVFGNTTGIAPGYKGFLSWWKLELASEGEFVVDVGNSAKSYFYNWSELSLAPVEWFRFGLVTQRTRLYKSERDIQRGVLAGIRIQQVEFTAYVFNPDDSKPLVVLAVSLSLP